MSSHSSGGVLLSASPDDALIDEPIEIHATGLRPGATAIIEALRTDAVGLNWRAWGTYTADYRGMIDLKQAPSSAGTYIGIDAGGLFWSTTPQGCDDKAEFQRKAQNMQHRVGVPAGDPAAPATLRIRCLVDGEVRAQTRFTQRRMGADVTVEELRGGRLRGRVFCKGGDRRSRGAIMVLTGSGGGVESNYSPLLASRGYNVVSLAYFNYEDRPQHLSNIDLEYFAEGIQWMCRRFGVERIAVQGGSRGGELSLLLGSYFPECISGVFANAPMHVTISGWDTSTNQYGPSWTRGGAAIPFLLWDTDMDVVKQRTHGFDLSKGIPLTPDFVRCLAARANVEEAVIPVERIAGPVLLISGAEDAVWPSAWAADRVIDRLRVRGFRHPYRHVRLSGVGHWILPPNFPIAMADAMFHPAVGELLALGGSPDIAARAAWDTWKIVLEHYAYLFPEPS